MHRLTGRRRTAHGPNRPDDTGAVAVLVAILISTVLLGVGALTVDLGSLWAARAGLQTVADDAALAAAAQLPLSPSGEPDPSAVRDAAVRVLCDPDNRRPGWGADAASCPTAIGDQLLNGIEDDGEVLVTRAEPVAVVPASTAEPPFVVQVRTPPLRVDFGLARALGIDGADVFAVSGARRGLPSPPERPLSVAPFYLTTDDLAGLRTSPGQLCLRATPLPTLARPLGPPPAPTPDFLVGVPDPVAFTAWDPVTLKLSGTQIPDPPFPQPADNADLPVGLVTVVVGDAAHRNPATTTRLRWDPPRAAYEVEVTTPDLNAATLYGQQWLWFEFRSTDPVTGAVTTATSDAVQVTYPPAPTVRSRTDCDPTSGRGVTVPVQADGSLQGVAQAAAGGLAPTALPFGSWPLAQPTPAKDEDCTTFATATPSAAVRPDPVDPALDAEARNCLQLVAPADVSPADLTAAWIGTSSAPGRLQSGRCSSQTSTLLDGRVLDRTSLFRASNGLLVDPTQASALRSRFESGLAPTPELRLALTPKVFTCGRLLLVPVLDTSAPPTASGLYAVAGLTYFWVWDTTFYSGRPGAFRGLITTQDDRAVLGIKGWVIDPGYVRGGDWLPHTQSPDDAPPMSTPRRAVLVRTPCDGHPDSTPCPAGSPP